MPWHPAVAEARNQQAQLPPVLASFRIKEAEIRVGPEVALALLAAERANCFGRSQLDCEHRERFPMTHSLCPIQKHVILRLAASAGRLRSSLLRDTRGAALLEYSILVGCVALSGCVGLVVVGVALLDSFEFVRRLILVPTP